MNILVVGAGTHQLPGILKLKEKGHYVIAVDGSSEAEGKNSADEFYVVDIKNSKGILSLLSRNNLAIDSAMCFSTEIALRTVAEINGHLGLVGLKMNEVLVATDKVAQREVLKRSGLPTPGFKEFRKGDDLNSLDSLRIPVVVKPTDNAGSRGVTIVHEKEQLAKVINESLKESKYDSKVIIEEFVPGLEFTVEAIIIDGNVNILGISEKKKPVNNYTVSVELFYNSPLVEAHREEIEAVIKPFLINCGFENTITHTEIIYSYIDHQFYVIETTVRSGGFHIFDKILPSITGLDIIGITIDVLLGKTPQLGKIEKKPGILGFFYNNFGIIKSVSVVKSALPQNVEYGLFVKEGDVIKDLNTDGSRLGYFVTFGDTWEESFIKARKLEYAVKFEII